MDNSESGGLADVPGKAISLARDVGKFASRYLDGPLEQVSGLISDKLRYIRWERQQRLFLRAEEFLREQGLTSPTRRIPLSLGIPLLEGGSLEENDGLQDWWARLLANSASSSSGIEGHPIFASILQRLSPFDALVMEKIYSKLGGGNEAVLTADLIAATESDSRTLDRAVSSGEAVLFAIESLGVLGCVANFSHWITMRPRWERVMGTRLGLALYRACTIRKP